MSAALPNLDLRPDHWAIIRDTLRRHVPDREVLAFGSRATWTAKDYSDLDLAIMGEEPLPLRTLSVLDEALVESDLPFRVDIVEWARVEDGFRDILRRDAVTVQSPNEWSQSPEQVMSGQSQGARPEIEQGDYPSDSEGLGTSGLQVRPFRECAYLVRDSVRPTEIDEEPYIGLEHIERDGLFLRSHGSSRDVSSVKHRFARGDVLFGKLRPYFRKVVRAPFDGICSTDIWVVRASEGINQDFLHYLMGSHRFIDFASSGSEGTRMPHANWDHVAGFLAMVPSLCEQRAIARILGTLDDKIELNRRMSETLEATARTLFKSWFVDFDPVRDKMAGRESGLPRQIADLFPDKFVDSDKGEIPEGWEAKPLKDCMNLTMGQSPPGSTYNYYGDGLPFFQGRSEFGFRYPKKRRFCSAPTRFANPEDTLVSVRAPVGDINLAWERCCIGRGVAALRHKSGSSSFTYHSAWTLQQELRQYEHTGTVFGAINKGQFQALKITEPDPRVVEMFHAMSMSLDMRIRSNVAESSTLVALRDTLLSKLISGEIRIGMETAHG